MAVIDRATLKRGPAYFTYASATFEARERFRLISAPTWAKVLTSMFGPIDNVKIDHVLKFSVRLWGAWENLGIIFPSYLMNPIPGTSVFGSSDSPLAIQCANADLITIVNAQITGMSGLYLGPEQDLFSADVEFTGLIANSTNPETTSAYTTIATNAYSAATEAFAKTNFKRRRFTGAWGSKTGFTAIIPDKGVNISWAADLSPKKVSGYGTVDYTVKGMTAQAKCIPIGPTMAQVKTNLQEEATFGTLGSVLSADLTWTGDNSGPVIVIKGAHLKQAETVFDAEENRVGEVTFEGTRTFASGAPAVAASVA